MPDLPEIKNLDQQSENNDQIKSLNKARLENEGKLLKSFEVMDNIYQRVRHRTNDSIHKLDKELKQNARQLYYEKKTDLYTMLKDKKKQDELNIEELSKKT